MSEEPEDDDLEDLLKYDDSDPIFSIGKLVWRFGDEPARSTSELIDLNTDPNHMPIYDLTLYEDYSPYANRRSPYSMYNPLQLPELDDNNGDPDYIYPFLKHDAEDDIDLGLFFRLQEDLDSNNDNESNSDLAQEPEREDTPLPENLEASAEQDDGNTNAEIDKANSSKKSNVYSLRSWTEHESLFTNFQIEEAYHNFMKSIFKHTRKNKQREEDKLKISQSSSSLDFVCVICETQFANESLLDDHIRTHTLQTADDNCPHCEFTYKSKSQLTRHFKRCHRDQLLVCHMCAQVFVDYHEYDEHVTTRFCHVYKCQTCDLTFAFTYALKLHLREHVAGDRKKKNGGKVDGHSKQKERVEVKTGLKLQKAKRRVKVRKIVKPKRVVIPKFTLKRKRDAKVKCNKRRKPVAKENGTTLKRKMKVKATVVAKKQKIVHVEEEIKPKLRTSGNVQFKQRPGVNVGKKFVCGLCGFGFNVRVTLVRHMRLKHAPQRFTCQFCGKKFVRADHYQIHLRRHKNLKPCVCEFCKKSFCQKSDLNRHCKYVHLGGVRKGCKKLGGVKCESDLDE